MKAFARCKNEIWCMDLTNVENLADYNGLMCLVVCQNFFDETVDAEEMITKDFSNKLLEAF